MIFLLNTSEDQYFSENFPGKKLLEEWMQMKELPFEVIPYCGEIEDMVVSMGDAAASWIEENKFNSALPKIIKSGYSLLNLVQYFTVGADEVRAWPVRADTIAPDAAGVIHTDFTANFAAVEVTKYTEFLEHQAANPDFKPLKFNKYGKKYVVEDGDILQFIVRFCFFSSTILHQLTFILFPVDGQKEINRKSGQLNAR